MALPRAIEPFLWAVWEECIQTRNSKGDHSNPEFGLPPHEIRIYQAARANWTRGFCLPPYLKGWRTLNGEEVEEIAADDLPDYRESPSGLYWPVGKIDFIIDQEHKRALYSVVLGPRFGRGYKVTFEDPETSVFVPEWKKLVWMS